MERKDIFDYIMGLPILRIFEPFYKKHKEALLYLLFGGLTTLLSIVVFWIFNSPLKLNEHISNIISWICAVTFAFFTNRKWVFDAADTDTPILKQMASFFAGRLFTLGVEEVIIFVFITMLGFNAMLIKLIAQVLIILLNYVISKLIVFKKA